MSTITTPAAPAVGPSPDRAEGEPAATAATGRRPARSRRVARAAMLTPRAVWALAALVLVAALALGATEGRQWYAAQQGQQAAAEASAAARALAVNFVSVDYQQIDRDTARVKEGATGTFLESYTKSVEELKKVIVANKTVSRVERTEVGLVSGDLDSAVALVGVVAPTTNTAVPDGETKTYRMRMELRKVSDAWKVENLEFVG